MKNLLFAILTPLAICPAASAKQNAGLDRAVQAVRQFTAKPGIKPKVSGLQYDPERLKNFYYEVEVKTGQTTETYQIGAFDGTVYSAVYEGPESSAPPTLPVQEAIRIASQFVSAHYPPFRSAKWKMEPEKYFRVGSNYVFTWRRVLNKYGTLSPWWISAVLDGSTGRVLSYGVPPPRIFGPTIPKLTLKEAIRIASPHASFDITAVPFDEVSLEIVEDRLGIQRLIWTLYQNPIPNPEDPTPPSGVFVDAITGEVTGVRIPQGSLSHQTSTRPAGVGFQSSRKAVTIRTSAGQELASSVPPVIQRGVLWGRVELLRALGSIVQIDSSGASVLLNNRAVSARLLGAKYHDLGWWVPLRGALNQLGWTVDWLPEAREAVVRQRKPSPYVGVVSPGPPFSQLGKRVTVRGPGR